jgi:hypothetical protein
VWGARAGVDSRYRRLEGELGENSELARTSLSSLFSSRDRLGIVKKRKVAEDEDEAK